MSARSEGQVLAIAVHERTFCTSEITIYQIYGDSSIILKTIIRLNNIFDKIYMTKVVIGDTEKAKMF